jgi:hypothetical protein
LALSPLRPTISIVKLNTCDYSPSVTSSLTRGWVCCLQLLLTLASAVILRSESRGTHDHILLSQIRDSPTWKARSPYLFPPGTGWPSYTPRHWVPFSSTPTTHRVPLCIEQTEKLFPKIPLLYLAYPLPSNGRLLRYHYSALQASFLIS